MYNFQNSTGVYRILQSLGTSIIIEIVWFLIIPSNSLSLPSFQRFSGEGDELVKQLLGAQVWTLNRKKDYLYEN